MHCSLVQLGLQRFGVEVTGGQQVGQLVEVSGVRTPATTCSHGPRPPSTSAPHRDGQTDGWCGHVLPTSRSRSCLLHLCCPAIPRHSSHPPLLPPARLPLGDWSARRGVPRWRRVLDAAWGAGDATTAHVPTLLFPY